MVIEYRVKQVYGVDTKYPANHAAQMICDLTGKKTLTDKDIRTASQYGYSAQRVM